MRHSTPVGIPKKHSHIKPNTANSDCNRRRLPAGGSFCVNRGNGRDNTIARLTGIAAHMQINWPAIGTDQSNRNRFVRIDVRAKAAYPMQKFAPPVARNRVREMAFSISNSNGSLP